MQGDQQPKLVRLGSVCILKCKILLKSNFNVNYIQGDQVAT